VEAPNVVEIALELTAAKAKETAAKAKRVECEELLAELLPFHEKGRKTHNVASSVKITVDRGWIIKADCKEIDKIIKGERDPMLSSPVSRTVVTTLDAKAYEALKKSNPDLYARLAEHVERKPKKVAVTVKIKE
jgi:hypothetical protein